MNITRITSAVATIALLVVAAPASAKQQTYHYSGKTDDGNSISFDLTGKRVSNLRGYVTTTCVPDHGTPRTSPGEFNPPGSFRLGGTRKVSETHYVSYWGNTTFNYKVSIKKRGAHTYVAKLGVNYSYVQYLLPGGGQVDQIGYVCQGDDGFSFKK
jgi:hypothetical protein